MYTYDYTRRDDHIVTRLTAARNLCACATRLSPWNLPVEKTGFEFGKAKFRRQMAFILRFSCAYTHTKHTYAVKCVNKFKYIAIQYKISRGHDRLPQKSPLRECTPNSRLCFSHNVTGCSRIRIAPAGERSSF